MSDRRYTKDHEWVEVDGDVATVGITRYAADKLGDVVYVDLPKPGATVAASTVVGEIESTKSVGELIAPVDGEVLDANQDVVGDPSLINADADAAWLITVRFTALPELLTAEQYAELTAE
jgi:glycine cleavage system H protein